MLRPRCRRIPIAFFAIAELQKYSVQDAANIVFRTSILYLYQIFNKFTSEYYMKNRTGKLLLLALVISLIACGCSASGSVTTHGQQNKAASASK